MGEQNVDACFNYFPTIMADHIVEISQTHDYCYFGELNDHHLDVEHDYRNPNHWIHYVC